MSHTKLDLRSWTALRYVAYCLDYSVNLNVTSKFYNTVAYILAMLPVGPMVEGVESIGPPYLNDHLTPDSFYWHDLRNVTVTIKNRYVVSAPEIEPLTFRL